MQGLLRWVSTMDSAAERALRIIEFFDQLTLHGADLEAVTRATAVMAEATAGAEDDVHDVACAMTSAGRPAQETGAPTISRPAAQHDPLRDEGMQFATRLAVAGVPVDLHHFGRGFHSFDSFDATRLGLECLDIQVRALQGALAP